MTEPTPQLTPVSHPPEPERRRKWDKVIDQALAMYRSEPDQWLKLEHTFASRQGVRYLPKTYEDWRGPDNEAVLFEIRRVRNDSYVAGTDTNTDNNRKYVYELYLRCVPDTDPNHPSNQQRPATQNKEQ